MDGVTQTFGILRDAGLPLGLATSSDVRLIEAVLSSLDLTGEFAVTCSAADEEFGKPHPAVYLTTAAELGVDPASCLVFEDSLFGVQAHKPDVEPLSDRLWRRYGRRAFEMLDEIRLDPSMGTDIMENADYLRVELHVAAGTEMITKLEDFMRRRSKITQVVPSEDIRNAEGIREVAEILFGEDADRRLVEFFGEVPPGASV